jgi:hypothetical protein
LLEKVELIIYDTDTGMRIDPAGTKSNKHDPFSEGPTLLFFFYTRGLDGIFLLEFDLFRISDQKNSLVLKNRANATWMQDLFWSK